MNLSNSYRNLLIMAYTFANKERFNVKVGNYQTASCDKDGTIRIPHEWTTSQDPDAEKMIIGIIAHEAGGHGVNTDFNAYAEACRNSQVRQHLMNILEDIFIENQIIKYRPHLENILMETVKVLNEKYGFFANLNNLQGYSLLLGSLLICGRAWGIPSQHKVLGSTAKSCYKQMKAEIGGEIWSRILRLTISAKYSQSTADNAELCEQILHLLQYQEEKQPKEQEDKKKQRDGNGSSPSHCPLSEDGDIRDLFGDVVNDSQSKGLTDTQQQNLDAVAEDIQNDFVSQKVVTELSEMLNESIQEICSKQNISRTQEMKILNDPPHRKHSATIEKTAQGVSLLANNLLEWFEAESRCKTVIREKGRRLSGKHLFRSRLDNPNIFKHRHTHKKVETAVLVLTDLSGSMDVPFGGKQNRSDAVIGMMLGFGNVFDELGVQFALHTYDENLHKQKRFEESWLYHTQKDNVARHNGSTSSGMALTYSLIDLVQVDAERKIVIFLTDGETTDQEILESCYAEAQSLGIEFANIFIGGRCANVDKLAEKFGFSSTTCSNPDELNNYVLTRLEEALGYTG